MKKEMKNAINTIIKNTEIEYADYGIKPILNEPNVMPIALLMVDGTTQRNLSPMLKIFYSIVGSWEEAFIGKSVVNPQDMEFHLKNENIADNIALRIENDDIFPPGGEGDITKTALFAIDVENCEESYFWWRYNDLIEPLVVDFFGGSVNIFKNIMDFLNYQAYPNNEHLRLDLLDELMRERWGEDVMREIGILKD